MLFLAKHNFVQKNLMQQYNLRTKKLFVNKHQQRFNFFHLKFDKSLLEATCVNMKRESKWKKKYSLTDKLICNRKVVNSQKKFLQLCVSFKNIFCQNIIVLQTYKISLYKYWTKKFCCCCGRTRTSNLWLKNQCSTNWATQHC